MADIRDEHQAQLRDALAHVPAAVLTGEHQVILDWLAGWDDRVVDGVCALLNLAVVYAESGAPAPKGVEPESVRDAYRPDRTPNGGEQA